MPSSTTFRIVSVCLLAGMPWLVGCAALGLLPPEAILAGTWLLSAPEEDDEDGKVFVFDQSGRLTEIRSTSGNITIIERDVHEVTSVTGQTVRIETAGGLIFEGTIDATMTIITGSLRTEFTVPFTSTTIITDLGDATFTKQ